MMSAGEASGDMHGAHLALALKERDMSLELFGMGGSRMEKAGVNILFDPTKSSVMGFTEVLASVRTLKMRLAELGGAMEREKPDALVVIDFPEFNMRLAEKAKSFGVPVVYYFSPSAWAWRKGRARKIAEQGATVCAVFPFEAEVYEQAGADVEFVGHPLLDVAVATKDRSEARKDFDCDGKRPVVALLPGSRKQEIRVHVPVMADAARLLRERFPGVRFLLPLAHTVDRSEVESMLGGDLPVTVLEGHVYDVLVAADAAIAVSGTVTLEAALIGTPAVVIYKASSITYVLAKLMYKLPWFSLPNIVLGRHLVDEIAQKEMTAERIASRLADLLRPERRAEVLEGYREIRRRLGGAGATGRAAETVLQVASGARGSRGSRKRP